MVTCSNGVAHAHYDRTPSLKLSPGHTQPVAFKCFAVCTQDQVLDAEGLGWGDVLKGPSARFRRAESGAEYVRALRLVDNEDEHE